MDPGASWQQTGGATPIILRLWHPVNFGEARVSFRAIDDSSGLVLLQVLYLGSATLNQTIAPYVVGEHFHFSSVWNRLSSLGFSISNDNGLSFAWDSKQSMSVQGVWDLQQNPLMDFSVIPWGTRFASATAFFSPLYHFPGDGRFASFTGDAAPLVFLLIDLSLIGVLLLPEEKQWIRSIRLALMHRTHRILSPLSHHWEALALLVVCGALYGYLGLVFGGHPFDNIVFKTWTYSAQQFGLQGVYGRSSSVSDSFMRGDNFPYSSLGFAYLPLAAFLMLLISVFIPPQSRFSSESLMFQSATLEGEIKFCLALFTLLAGLALYFLVVAKTGRRSRALIGMAIFLLNPAILFDSAIWGETDSVLYLTFIIFAWFATKRPLVAVSIFPFLLGVKQTGLVLAFPVALILAVRPWRATDWLLTWARGGTIFLVGLVPLVVGGVLPSAFFRPLFGKTVDIGTSIGAFRTYVSADTYTIWTTFTGIVSASGISRLHVSSTSLILGPISFYLIGYVTFAVLLISLLTIVVRRRGCPSSSFWFLVVGFAPVALTTLIAGAASRYYTLAIPGFVGAAALGWDDFSKLNRKLLVLLTSLISFLSLWTMAGSFTYITSHELQNIRGLDPSGNILMAFVQQYYANDVVITLGSLGAIVTLAIASYFVLDISVKSSNMKGVRADNTSAVEIRRKSPRELP